MLKDFMLFIKYPYTAGVIATIWQGSAALMALNSGLPMVRIVSIDMLTTVIIAAIGFSGQKN